MSSELPKYEKAIRSLVDRSRMKGLNNLEHFASQLNEALGIDKKYGFFSERNLLIFSQKYARSRLYSLTK